MREKPLLTKAALLAAALAVMLVGSQTAAGYRESAPESPLSVDQVAHNAGKYHRKVIRVEGRISSRVRTKHFKGKDYTIFKMKNSEDGATMLVYLRGFHTNLERNNRLSIRGRFYEKRKYLFIKLKNVLKGRNFKILS